MRTTNLSEVLFRNTNQAETSLATAVCEEKEFCLLFLLLFPAYDLSATSIPQLFLAEALVKNVVLITRLAVV